MPEDPSPATDPPGIADVEHALTRAREAIAADDLPGAARWADRARRLAPMSAKVAELQGRLALRAGAFESALTHLEAAAREGTAPGVDAAVVETLLRLDRAGEASRRLENALVRFAVASQDPLWRAARACARATGAQGWMALGPDLAVVGETRTQERARDIEIFWGEKRLTQSVTPASWPDEGGGAFRAEGRPGAAGQVRAGFQGAPLLGSGLPAPPALRLDGRVRVVEGRLKGWVTIGWSPALAPQLRMKIGSGALSPVATAADPLDATRWLFDVDVGAGGDDAEIAVDVQTPWGETTPLPGSPARGTPPPAPAPSVVPKRRLANVLRPREPVRTDVIIPVFRGEAQTLACIASVRATTGPNAEIVVIDDASPEPALSAALKSLAEGRAITLLVNDHNIGFAGSVNRALALHPGRDVVLLNADTEVFPGWLERLQRAAYAAADIGTVTPLSNAATIASYPKGLYSPSDAKSAAALHSVAGEVNKDITVESPVGVGFCLFIRDECRAAAGPLDETCFGRGYGEETDFCLRAGRLGWRHVIAADVYVRHDDAVSFGALRGALITRNEALLAARHPDYAQRLEAFGAADPLAKARRRLDEARLLDRFGPLAVLISHARGGGVERFVTARRAELNAKGQGVVVLRPEGDKVRLEADDPMLLDLVYDPETEAEALISLMRALRPSLLEAHHAAGHHIELLRRVLGEGLEVSIFVHDYSWFCPRITLIDGSGAYCGEPDLATCEACIAVNGAETQETSVADLRARSAALFRAARRVTAPSNDAARRIARRFEGIKPIVRPLERRGFLPTRRAKTMGPVKVLVLGAIGDSKGFEVLLAAARDAQARRLDLSYVVIGFTRDDDAVMALGNVFVTGAYAETEAQALIQREAPDVALFASVWPETWLYTLTHALTARLPVLAFDIGAQAERIRDAKAVSALLPLSTDPAALNDALIELAHRPGPRRLDGFRTSVKASDTESAQIAPDAPLPAPLKDVLPEAPPLALQEAQPVVVQQVVQQEDPGPPPAKEPPSAVAAPENLAPPALAPSRDPLLSPHSQRAPSMSAPPNSPDAPAMPKPPIGLAASAQILTLAVGIYRFSVSAGGGSRRGQDKGVNLPALQIAVAPGALGGNVEFMTGLKTDGAWLFEEGDVLIAKVKAAETPLLVTSYSVEGLARLAIAVERIDEPGGEQRTQALPQRQRTPLLGRETGEPAQAQQLTANAPQRLISGGGFSLSEDGRKVLRARVTAHISRRGDVEFLDEEWIGAAGLKLPVEGFAIAPPEGLQASDIEYKAVSEKGIETPWILSGEYCGTRRLGLALAGFAIRVRGEAAKRVECRYKGAFRSGAVMGPARNGAPLRSSSLEDVLTGLQLQFLALGAETRDPPPPPARALAQPTPTRPPGPRFSVFREEISPTDQ